MSLKFFLLFMKIIHSTILASKLKLYQKSMCQNHKNSLIFGMKIQIHNFAIFLKIHNFENEKNLGRYWKAFLLTFRETEVPDLLFHYFQINISRKLRQKSNNISLMIVLRMSRLLSSWPLIQVEIHTAEESGHGIVSNCFHHLVTNKLT